MACLVTRCPELADPEHGLILCDSGILYGSVCELRCRAGYAAVGQTSTECLEHARWSHDSLLCAGCPLSSLDDYINHCVHRHHRQFIAVLRILR